MIKKNKHEYYIKNREKFLKKNKENYQKNKQRYKDNSKKWKKDNRLRYNELNRLWQEKRTIEIYNLLNNKCSRCGFTDTRALQIHHKDEKLYKRDWFKLDFDLSKVELLCANCHAINHYGEIKYG